MTKQELIELANVRSEGTKYINLGVTRKVSVKDWEKNGKNRTYIKINCYTMCDNYKGTYDCGYWDNINDEYVAGKYDIVNDDTNW